MKKSMRKTAFLTGLLPGVALLLFFSSITGATVLNPKPPGIAAKSDPSDFYQIGNYSQTDYSIKSRKTGSYEVNGTSESAVLITKTNTARYVPGVPTIQDGISQNLSGFFSPIPEPGFYGVLAIGLALTFWAARFRPKQKT
jgi:hypothetical protein